MQSHVDENSPLIMKLAIAQHHDQLLAMFVMDNPWEFNIANVKKLHAISSDII